MNKSVPYKMATVDKCEEQAEKAFWPPISRLGIQYGSEDTNKGDKDDQGTEYSY